MKINLETIKQKGQWLSLAAVVAFLILFSVLYIVRGIFSPWTRFSLVLIVLGLGAALFFNWQYVKAIFKRSAAVTGIAQIGQFIVTLAVLVFLYLLSDLLPWRADLTSSRLYSLSDQTRSLVRQVTNDMQVYMFWDKSYMSGELVYHVYDYQKNLLRRYTDQNKRLKLEEIDPVMDTEKAEKYKIEDPGTVVFEYQGNRVKVPFKDIFEINEGTGDVIYKGEIAYTSALKTLLVSKPKVAYILRGHEEISPAAKHEYGHSRIFDLMQDDNIRIQPLDLIKLKEVPRDAGVVIIGAPTKPIVPQDLDKLKLYLDQGGSVLVLLDYRTDILVNDVLKDMGLFFFPNLVVEDEMYSDSPINLVPIVINYKDITAPLLKSSLDVYLPTASGIFLLNEEDRRAGYNYIINPLLRSSEFSYGEVNLEEIKKGKIKKDAKDLNGPLYPSYAARRLEISIYTNEEGVTTNISESRLAVIGDTDFINNQNFIKYGNSDYFMNTVNFLLRRDQNITTRPKINVDTPILVSSRARRLYLILTLAVVLGYFAAGLVIVLRRRSRVKG